VTLLEIVLAPLWWLTPPALTMGLHEPLPATRKALVVEPILAPLRLSQGLTVYEKGR
jgi:hypothetical protein